MPAEHARGIKAFYRVPYGDGGQIVHCCQSILKGMELEGFDVEHWSTAFPPHAANGMNKSAVPHLAYRIFCKLGGAGRPSWNRAFDDFVESRYLKALGGNDIAYLWPSTSLRAATIAREKATLAVAEQINCTHDYRTPLLQEAYDRLGWPAALPGPGEAAAKEFEFLNRCDKVFAPSPAVADSLLQIGIEEKKILRASYGWDPERFKGGRRLYDSGDGVNFLFVGRGCVRKGLPWLLRMWEEAKIDGALILMLLGETEAPILKEYGHILDRPDVLIPDQTHDIGEIYRSADVFIFPTHEEGSPLVSYEAIGCGLPCLVSPMGAAGIIRDGIEGCVLDPYDIDAWVSAMRQLAAAPELRREMGEAARRRGTEYTWKEVGQKRGETLAQIMAGRT